MPVNASSRYTGHDWISVHVFYHEDQDRLLRGCVAPLIRLLGSPRMFFIRHWQGGPHVRLRVLAGDDARASIDRTVHAFLERTPSHVSIVREAYEQAAAAFAVIEPDAARIEGLQPDNTATFRAFSPEPIPGLDQRYPPPVAYYEQSSHMVLGALRRHRNQTERTTLALGHCAAAIARRADPAETAGWIYEHWAARLLGLRRSDLERAFTDREARGGAALRRRIADLAHPDESWPVLPSDPLAFAYCLHTHCNRLGVRLPEEAYIWHLLRWALT